MSIQWKILGQPGADNALFLTVDSGQSVEYLLFDCGENCLSSLKPSLIQSIAHLAFSHFHMDHVSGFDTFFRHNYNRPETPVNIWGPGGTIELMHHRFRSFSWNLHHEQPGEWIVREIDENKVASSRFLTSEAFAISHRLNDIPRDNEPLQAARNFQMEAMLLPHGTIPSVAYRLIESEKQNISPEALQRSPHAPGSWLQALTDPSQDDDSSVQVGTKSLHLGDLREEFLISTPGESIAYLTDFRVEEGSASWQRLCDWLKGTGTLISECQYHSRDRSLAIQNGHMTSDEVGRLASEAGAGRLVLQHLSRRYGTSTWSEMLAEARGKFSKSDFPPEWIDSIPEP
ncbi:MAG: MBL fold metallo-hydrolase [Verrucomicrobiales bacterium]|nr:MBL fold metallo-hydrolase [Verrucomicrobiales bacterium]